MSEERDLRAAVIQDFETREVLMLGWMDAEAQRLTEQTGQVHFFSRSRQRLWRKGETSGNVLFVRSMEPDCDQDALLVQVSPAGPTCHTGTVSCFSPWLWQTINQRVTADPSESYVARTVADRNKAAQKVGEEATETVVAALCETDDRLVSEAADLWFHLMLLLRSRNIDVSLLDAELRSRRKR